MFALVIPGRPVIAQFAQISPDRLLAEVADADRIHEVCFCLLPGNVLPEGMMSSLYISLPPYSDWMRIGSISNYSPSLMAMVKWKTLPGVGSPAQFGISAETANSTWMGPVSATSDSMFSLEERREFSKAIATDLLRYLSSFGHVGDQGVQMLDTWFTKFSRKMDMDPDYWKRVLLKD